MITLITLMELNVFMGIMSFLTFFYFLFINGTSISVPIIKTVIIGCSLLYIPYIAGKLPFLAFIIPFMCLHIFLFIIWSSSNIFNILFKVLSVIGVISCILAFFI